MTNCTEDLKTKFAIFKTMAFEQNTSKQGNLFPTPSHNQKGLGYSLSVSQARLSVGRKFFFVCLINLVGIYSKSTELASYLHSTQITASNTPSIHNDVLEMLSMGALGAFLLNVNSICA